MFRVDLSLSAVGGSVGGPGKARHLDDCAGLYDRSVPLPALARHEAAFQDADPEMIARED
jgi:hypothetical protein